MASPDLDILARVVRTVLEETHAEYAQMPFFVRPMVRRGFVKRGKDEQAGFRRSELGAPGKGSGSDGVQRLPRT